MEKETLIFGLIAICIFGAFYFIRKFYLEDPNKDLLNSVEPYLKLADEKTIIVEDEIRIMKKGTQVWAFFENIPQLLIVNRYNVSNGVNGLDIEYHFRKSNWSENCQGIKSGYGKDEIKKWFNSKEDLINSIK